MTDQLRDHTGLRPAVVHGLLREGETLNLIAPPKTGKSWLVYDLALCTVTGKRWLDTFLPMPGRVLFIDYELHRETVCDRIPRVAAARGLTLDDYGTGLDLIALRGQFKDIHRLGAELFAAIEPAAYKLVIIDALYRALPQGCDENSNSDMAAVYNAIDGFAAQLRCAFVLVHHSTKGSQSQKSVTDVGSGAGSISRAADTHLILRAHQQPNAVVADGVTRSWHPIEPFCLRWDFPVWTLAADLDPAELRDTKPRKRKDIDKDQAESAEQPWTAERFTSQFCTDKPLLSLAIVDAACAAGLSDRKAEKLLKRAAARGLVHEWPTCDRRKVAYATTKPPEPVKEVSEVSRS